MTITEPRGVDSIGKLNEWIETCGMPFRKRAPDEIAVQHIAFGFGFRFAPDDRAASNSGYRQLAQTLASALYVRFVDASEAGMQAEWRLRPEFTEEAIFAYIETIDGSPVNWERMEDDDDDYRATMTREVPTDDRCGKIYARLMFIRAKRTDAG